MEAKETAAQETTPTTDEQSASPAANTQPEDNGAANGKEKTFTQEEVNRIVSERLSKDRERAGRAQHADVDEREMSISLRENAFECKEYVTSSELPKQLLEVFDTSDAQVFKASVKKLLDKFPEIREHDGVPLAWGSGLGSSLDNSNDFSDAFKPNI